MRDFFNSVENSVNKSLGKLDAKVHLDRDSKIKNTFVDDFIHELRAYLDRRDAIYRLDKLPFDSELEINETGKSYIQCYFEHEPYYIPKDMINSDSKTNNSHHLQLGQDGLYNYIVK